ncbi:MAG: hypothetical protein AB4290_14250 [Spirulina sp.]
MLMFSSKELAEVANEIFLTLDGLESVKRQGRRIVAARERLKTFHQQISALQENSDSPPFPIAELEQYPKLQRRLKAIGQRNPADIEDAALLKLLIESLAIECNQSIALAKEYLKNPEATLAKVRKRTPKTTKSTTQPRTHSSQSKPTKLQAVSRKPQTIRTQAKTNPTTTPKSRSHPFTSTKSQPTKKLDFVEKIAFWRFSPSNKILLCISSGILQVGQGLWKLIRPIFKWLWKLTPPILLVIFIWYIVGNFVADRLAEKPLREMAEFLEQHPRTEPNDSALKLLIYTADLDLGLSTGETSKYLFDEYQHYIDIEYSFKSTPKNPLTQEQYESISVYFDWIRQSTEDSLPDLPSDIEIYINANSEIISKIIDHIVSHEIPKWGSDFSAYLGNPDTVIPSYFGRVSLSRLILLKGIQDLKKGLHEAAKKDMDAVWKIHESFSEHDSLMIGQVVARFLGREYIATVRRMNLDLRSWQNSNLIRHDYRESLLETLEFEKWYGFSYMNKMTIYDIYDFNLLAIFSDDFDDRILPPSFPIINYITFPVWHPYFRLDAINYASNIQKHYKEIRSLPPCSSLDISSSLNWWNFSKGTVAFLLQQGNKGTEFMLRLELTQKLLQAKAIASETGNWPQELPDLESKVCSGERWIYSVDGDEMSLEFSTVPDWLLAQIESGYMLPLEYRASLSKN